MDDKKFVTDWLKDCDKQGILPWKYDFKQEVFQNSLSFDDNRVKRILAKESGFYGKAKCETEDSSLAQNIYKILWNTYSKNVIQEEKGNCDADVMNSFWTPFKYFSSRKCPDFFRNNKKYPNKCGKFEKGDGLLEYYIQFGVNEGDSWSLAILKSYDKDKELKELNNQKLQDFATLTHTIGNFTLVPKGFNSNNGQSVVEKNDAEHIDGIHKVNHNYHHYDISNSWSKALHEELYPLHWKKKKYLGCDSWKQYCKKFYMDDYESSYSYANDSDTQDQFLEKVNIAIEHRGKLMTKELCEKLDLTNLTFYKENDLEKIERAQWIFTDK